VRPDGAGHLLVNRSPRLAGISPAELVEFPQEPLDRVPARLSWFAALAPLVISGAIALVLRSPTLLLFGLMSPIMLVGQWIGDRRGVRRSRREAHEQYAAELATAERRLSEALAAETEARHDADPDPAAILAIARRPLARLWERDARADGIPARIGIGAVEARTTSSAGDAPRIAPVPICVDLSAPGGVGIAGARAATLATARALLGRIATMYSPRDLHIVLVASAEHRGDWAWTARLPHVGLIVDEPADLLVNGLARAVAERTPATGPDRWLGPRILAVVDGAADLRTHAGLTAVLADGHACGVHALALDRELSRLPAEASSVLDLTGEAAVLTTRQQAEPVAVSVDQVALGWADHLADALVPLRDSAPAAGTGVLPRAVSLLELLALAEVSGNELAQRWSRRPRSTEFPLGADAAGPVVLDLQRDGPHALVGGTTGSGKSELLVALVASLAAVNRPDELTFVLVDYKGGAAFAGCVELPHVVGLVTDLDAALTERALASLDAELKRRERLLAEHGCGDLTAYQARRRRENPPLPRLVLVVDELRALAEDLPDFVAGLVRVASLGRSLGIHLVVATQRPAGVVTADMRANLGLRIALRVRDVVDSLDVLDAREAARIQERVPGRAFVRSAATELRQFQGALVTGRTTPQEGVRLLSVDGLPVVQPNAPADTDLARLVAACNEAAPLCDVATVAAPWLAPLPDAVPSESLAGMPGTVAVGLLDDPAAQAQYPYVWDVGAGHLGITGPPRSGRTTALLTVAAQLALCTSPADLHLYAVHTGGLDGLTELPHVGAAVDLSDLSRLDRLVRMLGEPPRPRAALRLLLLDDWDRVTERLIDTRQQPLLDTLSALVKRGHDYALRAVVAGPRSTTAGPLTGVFAQRLLLLPADPVDLALAGLSQHAVPTNPPPGRALDIASAREVQLAFPGAGAAGDKRTAYLKGLGARLGEYYCPTPTESLPVPVGQLPAHVSQDELPCVPGRLVVGVGSAGPTGFRLEAGQRRVAVLGTVGSGRTSALATLAAGLIRLGHPVAAVSPARTLVLPGVTALAPTDVDALVALRQDQPTLAVLVDDTERLAGTPIEAVLAEIARLVDDDRGLVAVASTVREVADRPRGLAGTVAADGCALLLGRRQPSDEAALGLRGLVPFPAFPGRAHLVRHRRVEVVQLAEART